MRNFDRRDFLKYLAMSGASLYFSGCIASQSLDVKPKVFPMSFEPENLPASIKIVLDDLPILTTVSNNSQIEYPIVAGQIGKHPTPKGIFSVKRIVHKPRWYPPRTSGWVKDSKRLTKYLDSTSNVDDRGNAFVPYGHKLHPLGEWKIGFSGPYCIHGNGDSAIDRGDRYTSHGCVRMRDKDIGSVADFCEKHKPLLIHIV